jgi:hypothetical protein
VDEVITAEMTAAPADPAGRIPLRLRIAVTGHRDLCGDDAALTGAVAVALATIDSRRRAGTSATPVGLAVVSALAEGADRIVARLAMQQGASLEAVLPMPPGDYLTDFKSASSQDEFDALLAQATTVTELDWTGERDKAYERAGRAIVDRSDVVLALWDGQAARGRGGTAEIVSYAQQRGVPVLRVPIERPGLSVPSRLPILDADLPGTLGPLSDKAFEQLDRFNSSSVDPRIYDPKHLVMPGGLDSDVPPQVRQLVGYAQPYFHRAEQTARASQRLYLRLTRLLYSLAGAAVVLVATQIIFLSKYPRLVWAEVVALVAAILTLGVGRLARPHDRWIAARYLAERIRSGVFLAAVGAGDTGQAPPEAAGPAHSAPSDTNREWADRAFREISCRTPAPPVLAAELPVLRAMLIRAWIDDQIRYHQGTAARLARRQRQLTWLAAGLFGVSALAALFHSMNILMNPAEPDVWGYMSIIIPAIGAALSGYGAQREYARLAERSRLMVFHLLEARRLVAEAKDLPALQQTARGTALLMQAETADWYDVVRLHDFEVPA